MRRATARDRTPLLGELTSAAIDELLEAAGPAPARRSSPSSSVGSAARSPANRAQLERVAAALAPNDAGRGHSSFEEEHGGASGFLDAERYGRLRAVKADVDPEIVSRRTTGSGERASVVSRTQDRQGA